MGVARNPLRDGAPPTGFTFEHQFRVWRTWRARGQIHEALAVLHRASGQRCTTWAAVCRVLHSFARPISVGEERAADFGVRQGDAVHPSKTIWSNDRRSLLAQLWSKETLTFFARGAAGLVSPPASPVDCNLTGAESGRVRMTSFLERPRPARPGSLASRHRELLTASKTTVTRPRSRSGGNTGTRERPVHQSRIRSEVGCWKLRESRSRCRLQAGRKPRTAPR
jgi:hypothetical protein